MAHITKEFHNIEKKLIIPLFFPWFILYSICLRYKERKFVKKIPNIISIIRTLISPLSAYLLYLLFIKSSVIFFIVWIWFFGFLAYGDRIDGMIARNCNSISEFGKMIDAGSDKVFFISHMIPVFVEFKNMEPDFYYGVILTTFFFLVVVEFVLVLLAIEGWMLKKKGYIIALGANNFGKYKFNIEIITFIFSFISIIFSKTYKVFIANYIFYLLQILLVFCLFFASLSMYNHIRRNILAIKQ